MVIEFHKVSDSEMLIPFSNGKLQREMFYFLEYRFNAPKRINRRLKSVNGGTLRNIAYELKALIEFLEKNRVSLSEVSYEYIQSYLTFMQKREGWKNEVYNNKYSNYRLFFEFIPAIGVETKIRFPAQTIRRRRTNSDDDFFSHTRHSDYCRTYTADDGHKRTVGIVDYRDKVISINMYKNLYEELLKIDPVYAVMAQVMMQTCLRVSNTCQLPLNNCPMNREWMIWPEFNSTKQRFLRFRHIAKGGKDVSCHIWPETIKAIYDDYINIHYDKRIKLFKGKYLVRKNSTLLEGRVNLPSDILWLNDNGSPVKPSMVAAAFRKASAVLYARITPHSLRHTGATHLLWNYCQLNNIEPSEQLTSSFQYFLKLQLGHCSLATTRYYIRTILTQKAEFAAPFCLPATENELLGKMPPGVLEVRSLIDFYEG